jgi:hypothetical protein
MWSPQHTGKKIASRNDCAVSSLRGYA